MGTPNRQQGLSESWLITMYNHVILYTSNQFPFLGSYQLVVKSPKVDSFALGDWTMVHLDSLQVLGPVAQERVRSLVTPDCPVWEGMKLVWRCHKSCHLRLGTPNQPPPEESPVAFLDQTRIHPSRALVEGVVDSITNFGYRCLSKSVLLRVRFDGCRIEILIFEEVSPSSFAHYTNLQSAPRWPAVVHQWEVSIRLRISWEGSKPSFKGKPIWFFGIFVRW